MCVCTLCVSTSLWRPCSQIGWRLFLAGRVAMETRGVRDEQHQWCVFPRQAFLVAASSSVVSSASVINVAFQRRHLNRFWNGFNSFIASSAASAQSCSQQSLSLWQSAGTPGFRPWKAGEPEAAFNPCPLPAPSLHGFPLYMDMFCLNSSFLLAALSAAQRGTHSLFIGTYLGKGRNPVFLSNP